MKQSFELVLIILIVSVLAAVSCNANTSSDETAISIRVAVLEDNPPFTFIDEVSNEIVGFNIDLMDAVAKRGGYKADYDIVDNWDAILESMDTCSYDAYFSRILEFPEGDTVCWQFVSETNGSRTWGPIKCERQHTPISFSNPYFHNGLVVIVRADNRDTLGYRDLPGRRVGMDIYYDSDSGLKQTLGQQPLIFFSSTEAIQALLKGDLDAVVDDFPTAYNYVLENDGKIKIVGESFYQRSSFAIAVCDTNEVLLNAVNTVLDEIMADGTYDDLVQKWLVIDNESSK